MIQPFWRAIWNYAEKALKECLTFDPAIPLLGLYPKEIIRKMMYKNIYSHTLCGGKKLENERVSINWGMAEQIVAPDGDGILLC